MPRKSEEERKPRPIKLPQRIWDALDAEAKRCLRDSTKQLQAILTKYYKLGDVELHFELEETPTNEK